MVRLTREPRPPESRRFDTVKLALAGAGLFVWFYGVRVDDARFQWAGVAFLLVAFVLRFLGGRPREE